MALCGSQNCGCAIVSSGTITVTGSGNSGDPYILSGSATANPVTRVYTSATVWTKPAGLKYIEVEVQGAGGGSGGCDLTIAAQGSAGGGGGGGGYARKLILASALAATETVTVGFGGTAGGGGSNGGLGGTSTFGAHASGGGGSGGTSGAAQASPAVGSVNGGAGGTASGGDVNIAGGYGHGCDAINGARMRRPYGGGTVMACEGNDNTSTGGQAGTVGQLYGGGASGAFNPAGEAAGRNGALGGDGVIIVREFYS